MRTHAAIIAAWPILVPHAVELPLSMTKMAMAFVRRSGISAPIEAEIADRMVVDDWPDEVPITASEVDVVATFLGDLLHAFLKSRQ